MYNTTLPEKVFPIQKWSVSVHQELHLKESPEDNIIQLLIYFYCKKFLTSTDPITLLKTYMYNTSKFIHQFKLIAKLQIKLIN